MNRILCLVSVTIIPGMIATAADDPSRADSGEKPAPVTSSLDSIDVHVVGPAKIQKDDSADYRVEVRNRAESDIDNVVIEAVLTGQFRVESSNPSADQRDDRLTWKLAKLRGGATVELTFTAMAQSAGAGRVKAFARLDDTNTTQPPKLPDPLPSGAKVALKIEGPESAKVGETISLEAVIVNDSDKPVENGGFSMNLSKGFKLKTAPNLGGGAFRLEPGATLRIPFSLIADSPGVQGVRGHVEADGNLRVDAEREILAEPAEFAVQIEAPRDHVVGQPLKIRLFVANNRSTTVPEVQLFVEVPEGLDIVSGEAGALFNRRTRTIRWRAGDMQPQEERGFRLTLRPTVAGKIELTASAQSNSGLSARASRTVQSMGHVALGVTVEPSADVVLADDLVTVVFDVRDRGSQKAAGVVLSLDKIPGFTLETARSNGWVEIDGQWRLEPPREVVPGESLRATLTLRAVTPGDHLLKATVISTDVVGEIIRTQPVRILASPPPSPEEASPPSAN